MAKKVYNMAGGKHSAAALSAYLNGLNGSSVADGLKVEVTGSSGLNVLVKVGNGMIDTGLGYGRMIAIDADETVALSAASASNPRNDLIVAYIDNTVTPTTSVTDNTNNILKFAAVAGTPASSPTDPSGATIQGAVGAGNPYMILGRVRVDTSATSLTADKITDLRKVIISLNSSSSNVLDAKALKDGTLDTLQLKDDSVSPEKRSGGFKIGFIPASTFTSTGNKTISGVGFKPKLVRFTYLVDADTLVRSSMGAMDASGAQYAVTLQNNGESVEYSRFSKNRCIYAMNASGAGTLISASYVSMNDDGFTINVMDANSSYEVAYEAFA